MTDREVPIASVRYESYSHEAMAKEVEEGNDPGAAGEIGGQWGELSGRLRESAQSLAGLAARSEEFWQGAGGDALRGVLVKAAGWTSHAAQVSTSVGESVNQQAGVAARARAEMPPPVPYDPAGMIRDAAGSRNVLLLAGLSDAMARQRDAAEAARIKAADVMAARDSALRSLAVRPAFDPPPALGTP